MYKAALVVAVALVACKTPNPDFCCVTESQCAELGNPGDLRPCGPGQACEGGRCVASQCATSPDCTDPERPVCANNLCVAECIHDEDCAGTPGHPYCDRGVCLGCVSNEQCTVASPVCDKTCRGCEAHSECPLSNVCLPDGSCADETEVAYVAASGAGLTCTKSAPCATLTTALDTNRRYVKIATGALVESQPVLVSNRQLILLADPGAKLTRTGDGSILRVEGGAGTQVSIYDLEITGGTSITEPAIRLAASGGIPVMSLVRVKMTDIQTSAAFVSFGGLVTVSRSTFSGRGIGSTDGSMTVSQSTFLGSGVGSSNGKVTVVRSIFSNCSSGAIKVQGGTFSIIGNVLANNGSESMPSPTPAISVEAGPSPDNRLEFNSLTRNRAMPGTGTAIHCNVSGFVARNNIMSDNGTAANPEQVSGSCAHWYSIVRGGTFPAGVGNSTSDPGFVNPGANDLHLMPGSPALGAADPASVLTGDAEFDIDGHKRVPPADMGAYELP